VSISCCECIVALFLGFLSRRYGHCCVSAAGYLAKLHLIAESVNAIAASSHLTSCEDVSPSNTIINPRHHHFSPRRHHLSHPREQLEQIS
jgi:hypothetical protein